jgi:hypothetical protein
MIDNTSCEFLAGICGLVCLFIGLVAGLMIGIEWGRKKYPCP